MNGYSHEGNFWVYLPLGMALGLLVAALVLNFVVRRADLLALIAEVSPLAILPYGMIISTRILSDFI